MESNLASLCCLLALGTVAVIGARIDAPNRADRVGEGVAMAMSSMPGGAAAGPIKGNAETPPDGVSHVELPAGTVRSVVRRSEGKLRACWEGAEPPPAGSQAATTDKLAVRFVIEPDGTVADVRLGPGGSEDAHALDCVARTFYEMHFPAPESSKPVAISYRLSIGSLMAHAKAGGPKPTAI